MRFWDTQASPTNGRCEPNRTKMAFHLALSTNEAACRSQEVVDWAAVEETFAVSVG
jgi:hypothetical protein